MPSAALHPVTIAVDAATLDAIIEDLEVGVRRRQRAATAAAAELDDAITAGTIADPRPASQAIAKVLIAAAAVERASTALRAGFAAAELAATQSTPVTPPGKAKAARKRAPAPPAEPPPPVMPPGPPVDAEVLPAAPAPETVAAADADGGHAAELEVPPAVPPTPAAAAGPPPPPPEPAVTPEEQRIHDAKLAARATILDVLNSGALDEDEPDDEEEAGALDVIPDDGPIGGATDLDDLDDDGNVVDSGVLDA